MTVRELISELSKCDPDMLVVLSKDGEGNGYSPLSEVNGENNTYVPDSTWAGEVRLTVLTEPLSKQGYTEEDVYDGSDGQPAVVLWPTN